MAHLQQMVHQDSAAFDQIKSALHTFLHIVQQVTSDQYALFLVSLREATSPPLTAALSVGHFPGMAVMGWLYPKDDHLYSGNKLEQHDDGDGKE